MTITLSEQSFVPLFEKDSGFDNCVEAANASEALDKSKHLSPNLAVVDFSIRHFRSRIGRVMPCS
jgi:hypothetical protein